MQWNSSASPRPKKVRISKYKVKLTLTAFFDSKGIVHLNFLPQGQTVNQHVNKEVLQRLLKSVRQEVRPMAKWHLDLAP